jgi:glycosyltransferase involved in cell wall biosynthesis
MSNTAQPFVSLLTPTYNRRKFIPAAIKCYEHQTYPKNRMEWIILDDGTDSVEDLFKPLIAKNPNIRYIRNEEKILIGKKRNILQAEAKGTYLCWMDDDDYYPPERVHHSVHCFRQKGVHAPLLAGATECYLYFADIKKIYKFGPYGPNHGTNGTMVVHKDYANTHKYNEEVTHAEEKEYLEDYKNPMIQLDPRKVMLVMCHTQNTFDKVKLRLRAQQEGSGDSKVCKETIFKLKDFIKDKDLRDFYASL